MLIIIDLFSIVCVSVWDLVCCCFQTAQLVCCCLQIAQLPVCIEWSDLVNSTLMVFFVCCYVALVCCSIDPNVHGVSEGNVLVSNMESNSLIPECKFCAAEFDYFFYDPVVLWLSNCHVLNSNKSADSCKWLCLLQCKCNTYKLFSI